MVVSQLLQIQIYVQILISALRKLTEGQIHSINEFDHLKKAIDLLTMQLFEVKDKINSK